jgi:hypothetical protein
VNFEQGLEPLLDGLIHTYIVRPPISGVDHFLAKVINLQKAHFVPS